MELKEKTTEEYIIGAEKEMTFSIDTSNSLVFDILRSKMYSDKIGAVAREVASNSRDANREAGRENIPVTVQIVKPNKIASIGHQTIVFEDSGLGITPARMSDVFIKYASSTKRDSNNQTGGFGLGAKTPFAYSDTFTVITVCDYAEPIYETVRANKTLPIERFNELQSSMGVDMEILEKDDEYVLVKMDVAKLVGHEPSQRKEYTYSAIIDKTNKGKMILFESEISTKETGTRIVVPIKTDSDRYEFERKVIKYTHHWGENIVYKNFIKERPTIEAIINEDDFTIVKGDTDDYYELLVDGISYPLNKSEVDINDVGVGSGYTLLLKFNTGELTISANREAVQYDKETVEAIKAKCEIIRNRLLALAQEHIDSLPNYLEACKFNFYLTKAKSTTRRKIKDDYLRVLAEAFNSSKEYYTQHTIMSTGNKELQFNFKNKKVVHRVNFKYHTLAYISKPRYYDSKTDYTATASTNITENFAVAPMYYADTAKNKRRNSTIWDDNEVFILIFPRGGTDIERDAEMLQLETDFGVTYKKYSEVVMKKAEVSYNTNTYTRDKVKVQVNYRRFIGGGGCPSYYFMVDRKTKKVIDKDINDFRYFIVPSLRNCESTFSKETRNIMTFFYSFLKKQVIIINEASYRNWISKTGMKSIDDGFEKLIKKYEDKWKKITLQQKLIDIYGEIIGNANRFHEFGAELTPLLPKCYQGINIYVKQREYPEYIEQPIKFDVKGLRKKLKNIFKVKYPMLLPYLDSVNSWSNTTKTEVSRKNIQNYIKSIV